MRDPHNNVFYFYRGSSFLNGNDAYYDRQLENPAELARDVAKALESLSEVLKVVH